MTKHPALVVLLLLMAAAHASAATTLIAESVETRGTTALDGNVAAWITSDPQSGTDGLPLGSFHLEAATLRLEVDWEEFAVRVAHTAPVLDSGDTEISEHSAAVVVSQVARPSSFAFLRPWEGVQPRFTLNTSGGNLKASEEDSVENYARVRSDRAPVAVGVTEIAAATSDAAYTLTVTGDFVLSVWDMDFTIESEDGNMEVWTGERSGDVGPAPGNPAVDSERRQQAYLFVKDGVLEMQVDRPDGSVLYAIPTHLATEGDAHLRSATGTLHTRTGTRDVLGEDIRLAGPAKLELGRPTSQGLPARVMDGGEVWIGGEPVAMSYAAAPESLVLWPWLLTAALAAVVMAWLRPLWILRQAQSLGIEPPEPPTGLRGRRAAGHWFLAMRACNHRNSSSPLLRRVAAFHSWSAHRIGNRPIYTMAYAEVMRLQHRWHRLARIAPPLVDELDDERERALVALWLNEANQRLGRAKEAEAWRKRAVAEHPHTAFSFLGNAASGASGRDIAFA
jgi:hypothetical protein